MTGRELSEWQGLFAAEQRIAERARVNKTSQAMEHEVEWKVRPGDTED